MPLLGMTPLFCAVLHGQEITVKYFLDKGADPNKKDAAGFAPLHEAAKKGKVSLLLHLCMCTTFVMFMVCEACIV